METRKPIKHERFLSDAAKRWAMDPIRKTVTVWFGNEDRIINMGGGLPSTDAMPFKSMDITMKDGTQLNIEGESLNLACQYGPTPGNVKTVKAFRDLVLRLHNPPTATAPPDQGGLQVMVTAGNTEGGSRTMELLLNTGDHVLVDNPVWSSTLQSAKALGLKTLGVETDPQGMIPASLRQLLSGWSAHDALDPKSDIPRLLVTTPHGSNPTGSTTPLSRRREIYRICQEYDILILEDDPYYFLLYDHEPLPSYLSMDTDGRVIRLDSFSKVLAPGFRCGIISGSGPFLTKLMYGLSAAQSHPNSLAQVIYQQLFDKWGFEGLMKQIKSNCILYKQRRDLMVQAVDKHLKGMVEFAIPAGGMFLWVKVLGLKDTTDMIDKNALGKGVLVLPGSYFMVDGVDSPYIRLSFSNVTPEELEKGIRRLGEMIKEAVGEAKAPPK